jgi:glycosyltransferase involved in cell wall biosynthesis
VLPNHGIFVKNRLAAVSNYAEVKVINPIAWSPVHARIGRFSAYKEVPEQESISGLEVYHPRFFSIPKFFKSYESISYYKAVIKLVREIYKDYPFDLIDLHWTYPDLPTGYLLAKEFNVPCLVTLRGMEAFHLTDLGLRKHIIKHYLNKMTGAVALSDELKKQCDIYTQGQVNTRVIRNGVDVKQFNYVVKEDAHERLNLNQDEKIILSVGSLTYRKGFDLIIHALSKMRAHSDHENIKLYIIGSAGPDGDVQQALIDQVKSLGLEEAVIFKGQVLNSDLKYWYNAADVFCLASRGEGSPNVLTEALACGCPSVATNVGSVNEIIESAPKSGRCVPVNDVEQIQQALTDFLAKPFDRKANSDDFSKFDWDWCAQKVVEKYEIVLKK